MLTVLAPVAVCVYAFPSTIISAVPLLVDLPYGGVAVTGVLAGVTLGAGTLVAGLQRRFLAWTAVVGAGLGALGFAAAVVYATTEAVPWLALAAPLLGAGGGLCLAAGLTLTAPAGRPGTARRPDVAVPGLPYLGFAAPFAMAVAALGRRPHPCLWRWPPRSPERSRCASVPVARAGRL